MKDLSNCFGKDVDREWVVEYVEGMPGGRYIKDQWQTEPLVAVGIRIWSDNDLVPYALETILSGSVGWRLPEYAEADAYLVVVEETLAEALYYHVGDDYLAQALSDPYPTREAAYEEGYLLSLTWDGDSERNLIEPRLVAARKYAQDASRTPAELLEAASRLYEEGVPQDDFFVAMEMASLALR